MKKAGDNFEIVLKKGESIEATLPKPKEIPAAPRDQALPVETRQAQPAR